MSGNGAVAGIKVIKEGGDVDVELTWIIDQFCTRFPTIPPHSSHYTFVYQPSVGHESHPSSGPTAYSRILPTEAITSEFYTIRFKNTLMQWRIGLERKDHDGQPLIGFELHLVSSSRTNDKPASTNSKNKIQIPIDVNVSLRLMTMSNNIFYNSGVHTHLFQRPEGGIGLTKPAGLVLLIRTINPIPHAYLQNDDFVILKLGLSFNNLPDDGGSTQDKLLTDLESLLSTGTYSDFTINCGSETFHVHKLILTMRCPYFASLFHSGMIESDSNKLQVQDIKPAIMKSVLEFIYTGKVNCSLSDKTHLAELIAAAELYQVVEAKNICFDRILNLLNESSCGDLAVLGHLYNAELGYKTEVFNFTSKHWIQLTKESDFKELVRKYPDAFLNPSDP